MIKRSKKEEGSKLRHWNDTKKNAFDDIAEEGLHTRSRKYETSGGRRYR